MAAFEKDVAGAKGIDVRGESDEVRERGDVLGESDAGVVEEEFGFGDVGGEDSGDWEEVGEQAGDGGGGEELCARGGDHDLGTGLWLVWIAVMDQGARGFLKRNFGLGEGALRDRGQSLGDRGA